MVGFTSTLFLSFHYQGQMRHSTGVCLLTLQILKMTAQIQLTNYPHDVTHEDFLYFKPLNEFALGDMAATKASQIPPP